ncbi:hypothetical protein MEG1DRAFT_04346 [Photorhabdus temperata subsp. temperata Meg1]|uniref:Uncharacterized protein n=1 Tax=Photorhabdus temperata subsp. temperata Meg1 TaxID=1393735 RepID=A0A081RQX2_PHOTE|nr:hypothetical protein MEG1DRAFT_04346 [Photorhabdus temperata subsp. temperata Meg1]
MEILERFKKDTENHSIKVLHNSGLYRHLLFNIALM